MPNVPSPGITRFTTRIALPLSIGMLAGVWCWIDGRSLKSKRSSYHTLLAQVQQMSADADRLTELRTAPRLAIERERPNDELLAEIRDSMAAADIPPERWVANDPSLPVRIPRSPYKRLTVGLSFEEINLRQLVQFAYHLTETDPALSIPHLRLLTPREQSGDTWDVNISLSYLIYSPYQEEAP